MADHGWTQTSTLTKLQQLIVLSAAAPAAVARREGLSTSELHALRHLAVGPVGPVELARRLGVTTAASSGVVDRLVSHGHVVRRPHAADGRRTEVVLTESGRTEMLRMLAPMFAGLAAMDSALSPADRAVVDRYLDGALAAVRAIT